MFNVNKKIVTILTLLCFICASYSFDNITATHPDGNSALEMVEFKPHLKKTIEFPKQSEALNAAIKDGCTEIEIYIPKSTSNGEKAVDTIVLEDSLDLSFLHSLIIKHSLRSDRGYWIPAVEALLPLIIRAKNLKEITLTHVLLDLVLPHLPSKIKIRLECSCYYRISDTARPTDQLGDFAQTKLAIYQDKYPAYDITIVPIPDCLFSNF